MVTLTNTLDSWRANIARGVLEEHGIPAFVRHEVAAPYGPLACGGYEVMVNEEDLEQAGEVLKAMPETSAPEDTRSGEKADGPSFAKALGTAAICGAEIVLFAGLLLGLPVFIHAMMSGTFGQRLEALYETVWHLPLYALGCIIAGAQYGLFVGLLVWLLADYRRRKGTAGVAFVELVGLLLLGIYLWSHALSIVS